MMKETVVNWIKAAGIRAIKTFAQTAASLITVGELMIEVDWTFIFSSACVALIYSLLTSIAGLPELKGGTNNVSNLDKTEGGVV